MQPAMSSSARKFIGMVALAIFLLVYLVTASVVGDRLPDNLAVKLVYFALAGTLWGLPLFPLIKWMNREP